MENTAWGNWLTPTQLGYLAGVLDSDGSIGLYTSWRKDRVNRTTRYKGGGFKCDPRLQFFNTYKPMLEYIKDLLNYGVLYQSRRRSEKHKTEWRLQVMNIGAYNILKTIKSLLVRKREQAELICNYYELRKSKPYNSPFGQEEMEVIQKVKELNKGVNFDG